MLRTPSSEKRYAFLVEVPALHTADLDDLRQHDVTDTAGTDNESEFLLNCCGEPSIVRLRLEVHGDKDSVIEEVWGHIIEARLVDPSVGYGVGSTLTDEQLAEHGHRLVSDPDEEPKPSGVNLRGKKTFTVEDGRNKYGLVCLDCGATWLPHDVAPDHVHLGDDWDRCGPRWLEVTGVD